MDTEERKVAAFTGHRKKRLLCEGTDRQVPVSRIREEVADLVMYLYGQGYREFYSGMAEGFDMIAAEAVLQLREHHKDMALVAAIPFRGQPAWFDPQDQLLYRELLGEADRVVMLSVREGGTYYTVRKAVERGRTVINLCTGEEITGVTDL